MVTLLNGKRIWAEKNLGSNEPDRHCNFKRELLD